MHAATVEADHAGEAGYPDGCVRINGRDYLRFNGREFTAAGGSLNIRAFIPGVGDVQGGGGEEVSALHAVAAADAYPIQGSDDLRMNSRDYLRNAQPRSL